jgi:hypothetical protein
MTSKRVKPSTEVMRVNNKRFIPTFDKEKLQVSEAFLFIL